MSISPIKGQTHTNLKPKELDKKPAISSTGNTQPVPSPNQPEEWEYFCKQAESASSVTGKTYTQADITASVDGSVYVFGDNKPVTLNAGTRITFGNGIITVYSGKFKYGNNDIECLDAPVSICNNKISGTRFRLNNILAEGAEGKEGYIIINKEKYTIGTMTVVETAGTRISERLGGATEIDLYFDGKEHSGDYVSIDERNRRVIINSDRNWVNNDEARLLKDEAGCGPKVEFLKDNAFVRMEESDRLVLSASGITRIEISNRDKNNLIPEMIVSCDANDNDITLTNGGIDIGIKNSSISYPDYSSRMSKGTTPLSIKLLDKNGNYLARIKNAPAKFVFSNYSEFMVMPSGSIDRVAIPDASYAKVPARVCENLDFNYRPMRDIFHERFPRIKLLGAFTNADIKKLVDIFDNISPALIRTLTEVNIASEGGGIGRAFGGIHSSAAIVISSGYFGGSLPIEGSLRIEEVAPYEIHTFTHELAHSLHALYDEFDSILGRPNQIYSPTQLETYKKTNPALYSEIVNYGKKGSFGGRWLEANGGEANYDRLWKSVRHPGNLSWTDGTSSPREGVVSTYGCWNHDEDISEFVGQVYKDPDSFLPLVDPKNPNYDIRYVKKLNLLKEYGFITEERYKIIFKRT